MKRRDEVEELDGFTVDPSHEELEEAAREALEQLRHPPGPVRTLADMSDEEIARLEAQYGCKVRRGRK